MPDANHEPTQDDILEAQLPDFTIEQVEEIAGNLFGLKGELFPLDSERDLNFRIRADSGVHYVIKIANSAEDPAALDMQTRAIEHIGRVDPEIQVPEVLLSCNGLEMEQIQAADGAKHFVRVLIYLAGSNPQDNPTDDALLRPVGMCLARLALALRGFFHPAASYEIMWDLAHASRLRQYLDHILDPERRQLLNHFLDRFDRNVLPMLPKVRAQIVHNDIGPDNILVAEDNPGRIVGIIDFGDLTHTSLINDLAITIAAMVCGRTDPVEAAVRIITSYNETIPLERAELLLLYDLVAMRQVLRCGIANWRVTLHPENSPYIMGDIEHAWDALEIWRELDPAVVTGRFLRACGQWEMEGEVPVPDRPHRTQQALLSHRDDLLGPCYRLFYNRPLHIVRGEGVWLYDQEGDRYLDVYNNVPHVGHCHPHVVNAIARQARKLNTNTRYLHGLIHELAERITSRLPEPLSVCMFVCTGSEANDLAWRMSKLASGGSGALVTKYSYHGNGNATILFSTEEVPEERLPPHVQTLFAPTSDTTFVMPDSGMESALDSLEEHGNRPAMLLLDTAFTSDGVYTSPSGYLSVLCKKMHAAGGLFVADEVQAGFGRLGQHFWGFEFDDVIPDIVTMGKPMGNGHPLAAVVTRPDIAEALAAETGYFNTYGGNPVSCAAGLAVLDVIEIEDLQRNALEVGHYLEERLGAMEEEYPAIGGSHGSGLLRGVDIVKVDGSPDSQLADRIMNHLRQNGVLVGTTGMHGHTLKLRPPIVFRKEHVDILLAALTSALDELA